MKFLRYPVVAASLALLSSSCLAQAQPPSRPEPPGAIPAAASGEATAPVMAVWVEQRIHFPYMAFTAYYSCDGLERKVEQVLAAIGARPGFTVTARGCMNPRRGAELSPSVDIVVAMPQAATPETLAAVAKAASTQELAARAGGKPAPAAEATAEFPARLRRIDFRDSPTGLLQPGDCELMEGMRDWVFKPLGAKIVVDRMSCVPHTLNIGIIVLSIDVLEPVPQP
ncbi:MAG TPA: hypothetical protein PL152_06810 [Steroidobacteraceae bacterium]|nr:hypothetical protein [Steroidobacteraceae bacterium]